MGEATFINSGHIKWGDVPPVLPKGAKIAVLAGDPFKPGPYVIRLQDAGRLPDRAALAFEGGKPDGALGVRSISAPATPWTKHTRTR